MKSKMNCLSFIAISLLAAACAKAPSISDETRDSTQAFPDDEAVAIVHGRSAGTKDEVANSIVGLVSVGDQGQALCTGTLIARDTVLTAAHCVEGNPDRLIVAFGRQLKNVSTEDRREVDAYIQNPRWHQPTSDGRGDLALVHFKGKLPKDFHPIHLAARTVSLAAGTEVVMMGYGVTNGTSERGAGVLRETQTQILKNLSPTEIVSDGRKTSVCFGDSGGPALVKSGDKYVQWGVASSVTNHACNEASIHTSVIPYKAWIKSAEAQLRQGH